MGVITFWPSSKALTHHNLHPKVVNINIFLTPIQTGPTELDKGYLDQTFPNSATQTCTLSKGGKEKDPSCRCVHCAPGNNAHGNIHTHLNNLPRNVGSVTAHEDSRFTIPCQSPHL